MISSGTSTFLCQPGAIFIVSSVAGPCGCGRAAFLFINRNGKTRCLFCEGKRLMVAASELRSGDEGPDVQQSFNHAIV